MAYQFKGNPVSPVNVPLIGPLIYDELGREVLARHNEIFGWSHFALYRDHHSEESLGSIPSRMQPRLSYISPIELSFNAILNQLGRENSEFAGINVLTFDDLIQYWEAIPNKSFTSTRTSSVIVYPVYPINDIERLADNYKQDAEKLRRKILDITGKTHLDVPILVDGLVPLPDHSNGDYSITFDDSSKSLEFLRTREVPEFLTDGVLINGHPIHISPPGLIMDDIYRDGLHIYTGTYCIPPREFRNEVHIVKKPK
ncbi:hypothetical protein J4405_05455 [Candidatus Woesearchaeota archaeon]|nr:hypothetical protein [Candidatus Woesearchaeota archaeon]